VASSPDFTTPRNSLDSSSLIELFAWSRADFDARMAGSAIRRIGYAKWMSNIAIALGNALRSAAAAQERATIAAALTAHAGHADPVLRESVAWALAQGAG
jgi:epoxyqueuosine reductase